MKRTDKNKINWPVGISRKDRLLCRSILKSVGHYLQSRDLLVMCSGGLDSTVLAYAARQAATQLDLDINLHLLYVNHGLRPTENQKEVKFINRLATQLEAHPLVIDGSLPTDYNNLQDIARKIRYEALKIKPEALVFTAHHANDQAETKLFQFLTGRRVTGIKEVISFNTMSPGSVVIRPLLSFTKIQLATFAQLWNLKWCEDSSNQTCKYTRNKIRHLVIPLLEKEINPSLITTLAKRIG